MILNGICFLLWVILVVRSVFVFICLYLQLYVLNNANKWRLSLLQWQLTIFPEVITFFGILLYKFFRVISPKTDRTYPEKDTSRRFANWRLIILGYVWFRFGRYFGMCWSNYVLPLRVLNGSIMGLLVDKGLIPDRVYYVFFVQWRAHCLVFL